MSENDEKKLRQLGIEVREERLGAATGEFPTILIAIVSAVLGGMLGAIGEDIWKALREHLSERYQRLERDRRLKNATSKERSRVYTVYVVTHTNGIPVVYFSRPMDGVLNLEFDPAQLAQAESDIQILIKAKKVDQGDFLGINLGHLGRGPFLYSFEAIPSKETLFQNEITADHDEVEALTHALVGNYFIEIEMLDAARRHYGLAIKGKPQDPTLRVAMGVTYMREGNLTASREHWDAAAKMDGKLDILHYNLACYYASQRNVGEAARELHLAIEHGFRDIGILLHDPDFKPVLSHPEIKALIVEIKRLLLD
jgi:tetratricopeptide (TPR) repeat protein